MPAAGVRYCVAVALALAALAPALLGPARANASSPCPSPPVTPDGPCGMDLQDAWSHYTTGDPNVVLSYVEGGINWHLSQAHQLVDSIYVNWRELPVPCNGSTMVVGGVTRPCSRVYTDSVADYDVDHDGAVNVEDWAHDPRVHDSNGNSPMASTTTTTATSTTSPAGTSTTTRTIRRPSTLPMPTRTIRCSSFTTSVRSA
jgi:hypothetical protein